MNSRSLYKPTVSKRRPKIQRGRKYGKVSPRRKVFRPARQMVGRWRHGS